MINSSDPILVECEGGGQRGHPTGNRGGLGNGESDAICASCGDVLPMVAGLIMPHQREAPSAADSALLADANDLRWAAGCLDHAGLSYLSRKLFAIANALEAAGDGPFVIDATGRVLGTALSLGTDHNGHSLFRLRPSLTEEPQ